MRHHRSLLQVSLWSLALALAAGTLAAMDHAALAPFDLKSAHRALGVFGFLLPALTFLQLHGLDRTLNLHASVVKTNFRAWAWGFGALLFAMAHVVATDIAPLAKAFAGALLLGAAGATTGLMLALLPRESVVDVAKDPLTKGDDASLKLLRFAHFFLPIGVAFSLAGRGAFGAWAVQSNVAVAGDHVLFAGYGLLSLYGLAHLWVPRLSGVPAIAAGAVKGELHASLLGLVLLVPGFLLGWTPLVVAGGLALFVAAFTFMGTVGANIMKNKSRTQRVTPEFNYVPWTFAGAFWVISGVLLGVFLRAAQVALPDQLPALRMVHVHALLAGGFASMFLGFLLKLLPSWMGRPEPTFAATKWAFYLLQTAVTLVVLGALLPERSSLVATGGVVSLVALAAWFLPVAAPYRLSGAKR